MDVSQYLDIFIEESSEHIQSLSDNIMVLENEPENKDTINEIFRVAHSLKGMAGTMGFKRMQHLTHDMENLFSEVRNDNIKVNSELIDILFNCLDAIEAYVDTVKSTSDEGTEDNEVLIKKLNDFLESSEGGDVSDSAGEENNSADADTSSDEGDSTGSEDPNGKDHFKVMKVDENTLSKLNESVESGMILYGMTVHVQKECLLKAARAFLVFKALEDYGEIIAYEPSSQDIEDEKFDLAFSCILASSSTDVDGMRAAVSAVSEIEAVDLDKVTPDMYEKAAATPAAE